MSKEEENRPKEPAFSNPESSVPFRKRVFSVKYFHSPLLQLRTPCQKSYQAQGKRLASQLQS